MINVRKVMSLADKYARECLEDFNNSVEIKIARKELLSYLQGCNKEQETLELVNYYDSKGMKVDSLDKATSVLYKVNRD